MTAQKMILFGAALVFLSLFIFLQRQIAGATQAHFQPVTVEQSVGQRSLFNIAAAAALDPEFFDRAASHSPLTMALIQSDPATRDLDQVGQIRAVFDLADRLDHNAILERFLETADFGRGCRGSEAALDGLVVGSASSDEFRTIAVAAMLGESETGVQGLPEQAQAVAEALFSQNQISAEINDAIQGASASEFVVTGGCNS